MTVVCSRLPPVDWGQYGSREKGPCSPLLKRTTIICSYYSSFTLTRLFIQKGIYLLCIKFTHFLPPKSIRLPHDVYIMPDEWSVCVVCNARMTKWTVVIWWRGAGSSWRFSVAPSRSESEGIPVLKYFLSAILRTKGFNLNGHILHVIIWAGGESG